MVSASKLVAQFAELLCSLGAYADGARNLLLDAIADARIEPIARVHPIAVSADVALPKAGAALPITPVGRPATTAGIVTPRTKLSKRRMSRSPLRIPSGWVKQTDLAQLAQCATPTVSHWSRRLGMTVRPHGMLLLVQEDQALAWADAYLRSHRDFSPQDRTTGKGASWIETQYRDAMWRPSTSSSASSTVVGVQTSNASSARPVAAESL